LGVVSSICESQFLVYIATDNGIFSYDKMKETITYEYTLSESLPSKQIKIILYDQFRDFFWIISNNKLLFRSSIGIFWRYADTDFDLSGDISIGYTNNFIVLKNSFNYFLLDPYNGGPIDSNTFNISKDNLLDYIDDNTSWSSSKDDLFINIDNYIPPSGWDIRYNKISNHYDSSTYTITSTYKDSEQNTWFGTDKGMIIKVPSYSYRMEFINCGPTRNQSTISYNHNGKYIIGDNMFLRTGRFTSNIIGSNILSVFDFLQNDWNYIDVRFGDSGSLDINDILVVNDKIYLATMNGLSIYNLNDDSRKFISLESGLTDNVLWNLEYNNDIIYAATSKGISEISIILDDVVKSSNKLIDMFNDIEVYDVKFYNQKIYVSCIEGVFQLDFSIKEAIQLTEKRFREIDFYDNFIIGNDKNLWILDLVSYHHKELARNVDNFSVVDNYVWINKREKALLYNLDNHEKSILNNNNGIPGTRLYNIIADSIDVMFISNEGIGIYDWSKNE